MNQKIIDWVEQHCLDWMKDQGYKKKQRKAAALAVADVLSNILILRTHDTEDGDPVLYVSFGNYDIIHGIAWDWDSENHVWGEFTVASSIADDDTILFGEEPKR